MSNFYEIILESNIINFTIFFLIIVFAVKKFDVSKMLENAKNKIIQDIEASKNTKKSALIKLEETKKSLNDASIEVNEIINSSLNNTETLKRRINSDTQTKISNIKLNSNRILQAEENSINKILTSIQGQKSIELAKEHIIEVLKNNPELHEEFIKNSIKDLDKAVLWN